MRETRTPCRGILRTNVKRCQPHVLIWIEYWRRASPEEALTSRSRGERKAIIHGTAQILFAADVALCSLNGCMSKEKLDLFQFTAGGMAQTGARPATMPHAA